MAVIITLAYLVLNPTKENAKTEINSTSEPPVENSSATAEQVKENNLSHYRKLLEASPFLLKFDSATGQANDTTVFLKGHSQDKSNTATIHYDPRDEEFYWIEFSVNNMPLKPNRSDIKPLLDFTNLFDSDFSNYFDRNFNGIFKNEDDFVDDGRYMNQKKGLVFIIDGNVALNNTDIKKYPNRKAEIIAIGNFVSINVINVKKPSWLFNDFKRLEIS
jgi:hypothetical protein